MIFMVFNLFTFQLLICSFFSIIVPVYVHFLCYRPCLFTFSVIVPVYVHFLCDRPCVFTFSVIVPVYVHFLCYRPCVFTFSVIGPVYVYFLSHWPSVCLLSQSLAQCMFIFSIVDLFSLFLDPVFVY